MSADILTALADLLVRPKVIHRLPGRLRLHVPMLKKVQGEMVPQEIYETMADLLVGVDSFAPNYITGNVLVVYDPTATTEETVLASIRTIAKTVVSNRKHIFSVPESRRQEILRRLKEHLETLDVKLLTIEKELDLPDEIWA